MIIKRNRKIGILRYMADILPNHTAGILKFFFLLISQDISITCSIPSFPIIHGTPA